MPYWIPVGLSVLGVIALLTALFIAALILAFSAKLVGIKHASIGGAMLAIFGGGLLGIIVAGITTVVLLPIAPLNVPIAILAFFLTYIWTIKVVFRTSWVKAFLAWLMAVIIEWFVLLLFKGMGMAMMIPFR
jgi:hypothetical protein